MRTIYLSLISSFLFLALVSQGLASAAARSAATEAAGEATSGLTVEAAAPSDGATAASQEDLLDIFNEANLEFNQKNYQEAIELYSKIENSDFVSWEAFYNMGNAYFRLGKYALAMLYYEKAAKIEDKNQDIAHNISICKQKLGYKSDELPSFFLSKIWRALTEIFSLSAWAWLSIIFFASTLILAFIYLNTRKVEFKKLAFYLSLASICLLILSFSSALSLKKKQAVQYALVFTDKAQVKATADQDSKTIFILPLGSKLRLDSHIAPFYKVSMSDGNKGWIKENDIKLI